MSEEQALKEFGESDSSSAIHGSVKPAILLTFCALVFPLNISIDRFWNIRIFSLLWEFDSTMQNNFQFPSFDSNIVMVLPFVALRLLFGYQVLRLIQKRTTKFRTIIVGCISSIWELASILLFFMNLFNDLPLPIPLPILLVLGYWLIRDLETNDIVWREDFMTLFVLGMACIPLVIAFSPLGQRDPFWFLAISTIWSLVILFLEVLRLKGTMVTLKGITLNN